jgi:hypothetical protein
LNVLCETSFLGQLDQLAFSFTLQPGMGHRDWYSQSRVSNAINIMLFLKRLRRVVGKRLAMRCGVDHGGKLGTRRCKQKAGLT